MQYSVVFGPEINMAKLTYVGNNNIPGIQQKTIVRRLDGVPELYMTSRKFSVVHDNDFP